MAYPFRRLTTEKLKNYFKNVVETNCNNQEVNQCHRNESSKISRIKPRRSANVIETWIQKEINS